MTRKDVKLYLYLQHFSESERFHLAMIWQSRGWILDVIQFTRAMSSTLRFRQFRFSCHNEVTTGC